MHCTNIHLVRVLPWLDLRYPQEDNFPSSLRDIEYHIHDFSFSHFAFASGNFGYEMKLDQNKSGEAHHFILTLKSTTICRSRMHNPELDQAVIISGTEFTLGPVYNVV